MSTLSSQIVVSSHVSNKPMKHRLLAIKDTNKFRTQRCLVRTGTSETVASSVLERVSKVAKEESIGRRKGPAAREDSFFGGTEQVRINQTDLCFQVVSTCDTFGGWNPFRHLRADRPSGFLDMGNR